MDDRDWVRIAVLQALSTLVSEGVLTWADAHTIQTAWDERRTEKQALALTLDYERGGDPVSLDEAMTELMTGLRAGRGEHQEHDEQDEVRQAH